MSPNPATNILYISSKVAIQSVEVFDQAGHLLKRASGGSSLDVSDLSAGGYILRLGIGNELITKKFYKE